MDGENSTDAKSERATQPNSSKKVSYIVPTFRIFFSSSVNPRNSLIALGKLQQHFCLRVLTFYVESNFFSLEECLYQQ